ncbi:MAG: hypothetical protein KF829_01510 [Ferruginibacter sp.]|nr:hypothetical protein [Ferruginibacter sp.]
MAKTRPHNTLKRLRNHYRLVIMNEDTYEEVVKFRLNRISAYFLLSTVFLLMIGLTTAFIIFTPLKYYLPGTGYGNAKQVKEFRQLKIRTDSIEHTLILQKQYLEDLQKVLKGKTIPIDTNMLKIRNLEKSTF